MSNVIPTGEKKRLWIFYRTRFILISAMSFSMLALIVLVSVVPSYFNLARSMPSTSTGLANDTTSGERADALKAKALIAQILPLVGATTTPMDDVQEALSGKPAGVSINRISYALGDKEATIALGGSAKAREDINSLRKELEAKGVYSIVKIPVSALVGATGNDFTVTLVKPIKK